MTSTVSELQGLLRTAVNCIAVDTHQVSVGIKTDPCLCLCIRVASDDLGKVIGKHGNTIRALRSVFQAAGQQKGVDVRICVAEVGAT